jgi:hypothetical protein
VSGEGGKIDRDALLCALVLAPTTFARNRFFTLYNETWARRTRSRATQLRTIVRHLSAETPKPDFRELLPLEGGGAVLRYGLPVLRFERKAVLEPLELSVVRFALSRRPKAGQEESAAAMSLTEADRRRVEQALAKLSRKLGSFPTELVSHPDEIPRIPPTTGDS